MGRKRIRAWKHIYYGIASLIFFSLINCATIKDIDIMKQKEDSKYLLRGQMLLAQGDYEGSFVENQKVLSLPNPRSPKDEALFNMGLIYAHFGNPKKDFGKSIDFFKRLIKDYPKSPLVEQSKIWVEVLQENEELNQVIQKLKQVDIEIEERKREKAK